MKQDKNSVVIRVLVLLVIVLSIMVAYAFVINPILTGYVIEKQVEAQNIILNQIILQIQQNGFVEFPVGNDSLILVPYQPPTNNEIFIEETS